MKLPKTLIILISLFFLTGCYTQLQYSQGINRITDEPRSPRTYSLDGDEEAKPRAQTEDDYEEGYEDGYYDGTEDAYYYKDYEVADWYARHGFGSFYNDYFPHYYGSSHWRHYRSFYSPYFYDYYPRSYASISFGLHFGYSWGAFYGFPHHWHRYRTHYYWDPFYGYGYRPLFVNNYFYSNYAGYVGVTRYRDNDRRYGRRSIGTTRVRSDVNNGNVRSRGVNVTRQNTPRTTTVRSRSSSTETRNRGTVRSRSSSDNTSRVRSTGRSSSSGRSSNGSSGTTRRSRGSDNNVSANIDSDDQRSRESRYIQYRNYDLRKLSIERIRNRIEGRKIELRTRENSRDSRSGIINQVQQNTNIQINRKFRNSFNSNINSQSSSNSSGNVRSRSSSSTNNRGSVSSSRDRSSSRGTRSSSGRSGSSDRSRSRGN